MTVRIRGAGPNLSFHATLSNDLLVDQLGSGLNLTKLPIHLHEEPAVVLAACKVDGRKLRGHSTSVQRKQVQLRADPSPTT